MNGNRNIDSHIKTAFDGFEVQPASEILDNILGQHFDVGVQSAFDGFEVAPAPEMLDNILGQHFDTSLQSAFDGFEVAPAPEILDNILGQHFDASVKNAFDGFEATPAPEMLDNILEQRFNVSVQAAFEGFVTAPRPQVWEQINETLSSETDQVFSSSFQDFEAIPSAGMWAAIQGELDVAENFDAKFQEAFDDFAVEPSAHILENVLNREFDTGVRRSFMRHEIEPREAVWQRIRPLIPFSSVAIRRHLHVLKRVAAVLFVMLMFTFLVDQYYQYTSQSPPITNTDPDKPKNITTPIKPTIIEHTPIEQITDNSESDRPLESVPGEASAEDLISSVEKQPVTRVEVVRQSGEIDESISQSSSVGSGSVRFDSNGTSLPPVSGRGTENNFTPQQLTIAPLVTEQETRPVDLISSVKTLKVKELETEIPSIQPSIDFTDDLEMLEVSTAFGGWGKEFAAPTVESNLVDMAEDNDLAKMKLSYRGWYVSSSFFGYISHIANDEIFDELAGERDFQYDLLNGGNSLGLGGGYQFSPNFGVEVEFVRSHLSQSYSEPAIGIAEPYYAKANYYYIPLSFKYQTRRLNSMNKRVPKTISLVMGAHYGQLRSSDIEDRERPDIDPNLSDKFIQQEIGAFVGADYNIYMHPNIHLTFGLRTAAGTDVNNLSAPFADGTLYNIRLGGKVGLSYRFASRQYKWRHGIYY